MTVIHEVETHWLSSIEKIPGALKKDHVDSLLGHTKDPSLLISLKKLQL